MRRKRSSIPGVAAALLTSAGLSASALASPPPTIQSEPQSPAIFDGTDAGVCAWPSVVVVPRAESDCTGTLIHPRVVAYAASCGLPSGPLLFGETISSPALSITPESCAIRRDHNLAGPDDGIDWAFCVLPEPVDLPVTPPLMGCGNTQLAAGAQVAIVGFGANDSVGETETGYGQKRWAFTTLVGINTETEIAEISHIDEAAICDSDFGGPALTRLADGSWHAFGISSTRPSLPGCNPDGRRIYALMRGAVEWIEQESGIDVTPCTDADGTWNPNEQCAGFYAADAGEALGSWADQCAATPTSAPGTYCGPAFDMPADTTPPAVSFVSPQDAGAFDPGEDVQIDIQVDDESPIKGVLLEINGQDVGIYDDDVPYAFPATFPAGEYELVAVAEDWSGNTGRSEPVTIQVGPPSAGEESGTRESSTSETGDASPGETGNSIGCSVAATGSSGRFPAWAMLGLLFWRKRAR